MQWTVTTWDEFRDVWDGVHNFLMSGECMPFEFDIPPVEQMIEEVRDDDEVSIGPGTRGKSLLEQDIAAEFRKLPIDSALQSSFSLAHYHLSKFDKPGGFLHGFGAAVLQPWRAALQTAGFTFE